MNTFPLTRRSLAQNAFTLIELLVVITIIAVLAGLLLPVVQKVLENSRKVSAKNTESQIVTAVNSYQTEYGQYPVVVPAGTTTPTDTTFGVGTSNSATNNNAVLFNVLRALNTTATDGTAALNSRQIIYFESKNVKNPTVPKDGFIVTTPATGNAAKAPVSLATGDLVDPWGNRYLVRVDSGYTNAVKNPYVDGSNTADDSASLSADPTNTSNFLMIIRTGVIAWSYGYDGVAGTSGTPVASPYTPTPGDDVDSWQ